MLLQQRYINCCSCRDAAPIYRADLQENFSHRLAAQITNNDAAATNVVSSSSGQSGRTKALTSSIFVNNE